jgi:ATP-dependent DNA helicase RecQ
MINNSSDNEELTDIQREIVRQQDKARLDAMVRYCKCESCLRGCILEYFGQKHPEVCGNCGSCNLGFEKEDITLEAQMILSCVKRIYDRVGFYADIKMLARTLRGSRDQAVLELGLEELSTYGLLRQKTRTDVHELIDHLEAEGYLTEGEKGSLSLTAQARDILYRGRQVSRLVKKEPVLEESPAKAEKKLVGEEADLYEILKEVRSTLAKESGVPPFVVFSNATLTDMAKKKPINLTAFKKVSGVGELKANWYGKAFVERIRKFIKEQG